MWEKILEAHPSIAVINRNTFRHDNAFKGPVDGILNMSEKKRAVNFDYRIFSDLLAFTTLLYFFRFRFLFFLFLISF